MAKASAGAGASWALAGAALLVMVVFLAWLAMTSEPSVPVTIQEDTTEAVDTMVVDTTRMDTTQSR